MKFRNITTGVLLETTSEFVIEQMKKNDNFEEVKEEVKKSSKKKLED